jgi:hypothetical protein
MSTPTTKKTNKPAADTEAKQPKARMSALEVALARRAEFPHLPFPPGLLRFADLQASRIVTNFTQLKFLIEEMGFPPGREANFEARVAAAIAAIAKPTGTVLARGIAHMFRQEPEREWRDHIEAVADTWENDT